MNIKTSKHAGIISIFDKEFVRRGVFEKKFSKIAHYLFEVRQEFDYKELADISVDEAEECVKNEREFFTEISNHLK